jgi:hypothetical protein
MKREKIYILDSEKAFTLAERYKAYLENKCFRVETKPYGFNGVRITGKL